MELACRLPSAKEKAHSDGLWDIALFRTEKKTVDRLCLCFTPVNVWRMHEGTSGWDRPCPDWGSPYMGKKLTPTSLTSRGTRGKCCSIQKLKGVGGCHDVSSRYQHQRDIVVNEVTNKFGKRKPMRELEVVLLKYSDQTFMRMTRGQPDAVPCIWFNALWDLGLCLQK